MDDIFKMAKQLRKGNQDVVGDKCVKDVSGNLSFDNETKIVAWKQHYERLLNEEFSWNPEDLTADPVVGPPIHIDTYHQDENWQSCWSLGNGSRNAEGVPVILVQGWSLTLPMTW